MSHHFKVRINDGAERDFATDAGMYVYAALAAVLADDELLPLPGADAPLHVEIWSPSLVPEYGPYHYLIHEVDRTIHIATAVRK